MAENESASGLNCREDYGKEAVCIDAMKIYDSCSDKDCLEDIRVLFPAGRQALVDSAVNVRVKDVEVLTVYLDLQPIPFNKGFYSVDMTFFFDVSLELFGGPTACPVPVNGVSVFNKKVILYGSEGNVKTFSSDRSCEEEPGDSRVMPRATVQVAEPVALSARLCDKPLCGCEPCCRVPEHICQRFGGEFESEPQKNYVYVTVGLFAIVQMVRNVQLVVPSYDFCVPEKECVTTGDNPCDLFRKLEFPVNEFFPPSTCTCGEHS